jgi:hypothetical protein
MEEENKTEKSNFTEALEINFDARNENINDHEQLLGYLHEMIKFVSTGDEKEDQMNLKILSE